MPQVGRRLDIQGLRAFAVLVVVGFHAGLPVPGGFVGVDVFFVISGFVITAMLHREWLATGRIRFKRFYLRRFKRLTPALALLVSVTVVLSFAVLSPLGSQQAASQTGLGAMLLTANFVIVRITGAYFDAPAETNPLLNTWSLSVEEQFYLIFPAILALGWMVARGRRRLGWSPLIVVAGVAAVSFALAILDSRGLTFRGSDTILGFYSPIDRAWEFALGALLALALPRFKSLSYKVLAFLGILGLGLLVLSLILINGDTPFPGLWTLLPVSATLLLLLAGTNSMTPNARLLSTRPMVAVGDWSYSIYLWHWPFIVFAVYLWPGIWWVALIAAAVSFIPALASYRWVEQPVRILPSVSRRKSAALVGAVLIPPLALSAITWWAADNVLRPSFESGAFGVSNSGDIGQGDFAKYIETTFYPCPAQEAAIIRGNGVAPNDCKYSKPHGPVNVAVIGDSHAQHLFPGLAQALPEVNVALYQKNLLPPVFGASADMNAMLEFVTNNPDISTVIINNYWNRRGVPEQELKETLERLVREGKTVFIADDVPNFPFEAYRCRGRSSLISSPLRCTVSLDQNEPTYSHNSKALRRVVAAVPGVQLLETYKNFCSQERCSMLDGPNLLFRDTNHLNINGTRYLAEKLLADDVTLRNSITADSLG